MESIFIALDLGSDTLKVAYACNGDGNEHTGKIVKNGISMTALPAVAYYASAEKKWLFCDEVNRVEGRSFLTVVKIKSLFSLLAMGDDGQTQAENRRYYYHRNEFPKFCFPVRRRMGDSFAALEKERGTFSAEGFTPQDVCAQYFAYVGELVRGRVATLCEKQQIDAWTLSVSLVYPPHVGNEYIRELTAAVTAGFGTRPKEVLSMTKALSLYALHHGLLHRGESALIFNLGEESTMVVKATVFDSGLAVDGVDGHNAPLDVGGNDIDDAVVNDLEDRLRDRETMGTPSADAEGHLYEDGLHAKQYLFAKDVKSAKMILSMAGDDAAFAGGVPVGVSRDLYVRKTVTADRFARCIGLTDNTGVARRLADYIEEELRRPLNGDVKKIFLSGGVVETRGLTEFLKHRLYLYNVAVCTFENASSRPYDGGSDGFEIFAHEDAVYAPALGCALAAKNDSVIKTVLALSYGIRLFIQGKPHLWLMVNRGDELQSGGNDFHNLHNSGGRPLLISTGLDTEQSADMTVMSTFLTQEDIAARRFGDKLSYFYTADKWHLSLPTDNRSAMQKLEETAGLRLLKSGDGEAGLIRYYYKGARVKIVNAYDGSGKSNRNGVYVVIGVRIDGAGHATPYAANDTQNNRGNGVVVRYMQAPANGEGWLGQTVSVPAADIEVEFDIDSFVSQGRD